VLVSNVVDVSTSVDFLVVASSVGSTVGSEGTVGLSPSPGGGFGGVEPLEPSSGSLIGGQVSMNKNLMHFGKWNGGSPGSLILSSGKGMRFHTATQT
jgi:hypothetical protein